MHSFPGIRYYISDQLKRETYRAILMNLQKKSLVVFVVLLIAFLLVISVFFSTILLASYSALEEQYIAKDLNQAVNKLNEEFSTMSAIVSDWAPWDDTYNFVNGNEPGYIASNLLTPGFDNLNMNLIVITNSRGEVVYSGAYDLQNKVMVTVPAFFSVRLDLKAPLMNMSDPHYITAGILMLPEGPMIVASQPVVRSDFSGQPQGVVIMGRYLNREEISRLAELTQPSLAFTRTDDPAVSFNLVSRIRDNSGSAPGIIEQLNRDEIAGYALIKDIYGNDALILQITEARDIYRRGTDTTVQVLIIILAGGLFLGLVIVILLDRFLLKRMGSLALQVNTIGKSGSITDHVEIDGDDELSGLATEINRMLDTIGKFHRELGASEARFREMADLLPQIIFELDTNANVTYANKYGKELFGVSEKDLKTGLHARHFLIPEDIERIYSNLKKVAGGEKSPGDVYTMVKKDKSTLRAILFTSPIIREGRLEGFRGSGIDISERLRLEEALIESEEYLQSLIWSIRVGILVIDTETHTIVDVNPAALEMMGTTKDAIISRPCHRVICPAEAGRCPITDLNQTVDNAESALLTPDGREIPIIKYVVPVMLHDKPCLLETFIDNSYRKQIELKLAESEEKYRALAENSADIIFSLDRTGKFTYISPQVSRYGFTPDEVTGKGLRQFIHPDDQAKVLDNYRQEMHDGTPISSTFRIVDKLGAFHWIEENSNIKRDGQGNPTGMVGILRDVTDRIRLEEALEESTKLINGILQASPVGVFRLDPYGYVSFINDTFTRITGIAFETIRGTYWADILSQAERNRVLREIDESIRERRTSRVEVRYIHHDGTPYWLFYQTVPLIDPEGNLNGWVGTITDITGQKLIEDALKESEEKYRALTENTPDILFSTDMAGIITYASPQVNKYGFLEEEVIGKTLRIFIHPADIEQVENNLSRDLEKGAQFISRFRILDKWGTTYWFEEKSSLRLDISGKPIGIYGILRDVTERKRTEDAIELANKKLNLMNQITRHDILNTITGLLGCVDMVKATSSPEERELLLNDISELTRVIQRQITFTREYQEVGVHLPQWQHVNDVIDRVLLNFEKSGIKFLITLEKMEIYADPLLEKVFYNLVDNAIRYGETITTILIYPSISDKGLSLVFEDDGVGVEAGQKREIFKRGVGKHTGMGLFLTAEILAITGISIEENGVYGKGARFEIRIPKGIFRLPSEIPRTDNEI